MAGTMPHAIFVETGLDGGSTAAAYAAELPGCATFAHDPDEAAAAMPGRVREFTAWLATEGEPAPTFVGDNWYEVERAPAGVAGERASFTLDELPPSDEEWQRWLRWLELGREALADAIDAAGETSADAVAARIAAQDESFTGALGGSVAASGGDAVSRLYAARDALTEALEAAGPGADGVRRILRLAIADDLRGAAELAAGAALRGGGR